MNDMAANAGSATCLSDLNISSLIFPVSFLVNDLLFSVKAAEDAGEYIKILVMVRKGNFSGGFEFLWCEKFPNGF